MPCPKVCALCSSDAVSTPNPALKSAKSILKKGSDSNSGKTKGQLVQATSATGAPSEEGASAEGISPGAIAMMPIVPKRQDFVSALFRRPTSTSKKDKSKQTKTPKTPKNLMAEKPAEDPTVDAGEPIHEGAGISTSDVVVTSDGTPQPVDNEPAHPPTASADAQDSVPDETAVLASNEAHTPSESLVAKRTGFFSFF